MGGCRIEPLRPQFDRRLRIESQGANVTSDGGLLVHRELNDALQLTESAANELQDTRTGLNSTRATGWLRCCVSLSSAAGELIELLRSARIAL